MANVPRWPQQANVRGQGRPWMQRTSRQYQALLWPPQQPLALVGGPAALHPRFPPTRRSRTVGTGQEDPQEAPTTLPLGPAQGLAGNWWAAPVALARRRSPQIALQIMTRRFASPLLAGPGAGHDYPA